MRSPLFRSNVRRPIVWALGLAGVFCFLVNPGPALAENGLRGEALAAKVAEIAAKALKEPGAVGLSVAVAVGDEIVVEAGFGMIELEHDVEANGDSIFRIGSITKQFTAASVMKLIEEGVSKEGKKLTLDAPISDFIDFPTQGRVVTVRHLLTHTSGIKSYTGMGEEWVRTVALELSHDELLDFVDEQDFDFEPNAGYKYNNTGFYLLGVLIEEVSGMSYAEYVAQELFEPLGLSHMRYGSNSAVIRNRAQGYSMEGGEVVNDRLIGMNQPGAAGALISNAGDLVRWNRALVGGRVVSAASYQKMSTSHVLANGEETGYGFGLGIGELDDTLEVGHGGGIFGFNSMLSYYPDQGVTVAVISNSERLSSGRVAKEIARAALGLKQSEVVDLEISLEEIERVTGVYPLQGTPLEMNVFGREGQLFLTPTGQSETRLLRQGARGDGATEYRPDFDRSVKILFEKGTAAPYLTLYQGGREMKGMRKEP